METKFESDSDVIVQHSLVSGYMCDVREKYRGTEIKDFISPTAEMMLEGLLDYRNKGVAVPERYLDKMRDKVFDNLSHVEKTRYFLNNLPVSVVFNLIENSNDPVLQNDDDLLNEILVEPENFFDFIEKHDKRYFMYVFGDLENDALDKLDRLAKSKDNSWLDKSIVENEIRKSKRFCFDFLKMNLEGVKNYYEDFLKVVFHRAKKTRS